MTRGPARIGLGLLTDSAQSVRFSFDGRWMPGLAGDTLASALLANGQRLIARSFKYHRPRGIFTCGPEEPCGLVDVLTPGGREPNQLATTLLLHDGLHAESQNRWPSLRVDALSVMNRLSGLLPAGFYYKTFMRPSWAWERLYEPLIRRAAGLGRVGPSKEEHALSVETVHQHTDVLVVGAGPAGMTAAYRLGRSGLRVVLVEQDVVLGGGSLLDSRWTPWREHMCTLLDNSPSVRCLPRTTVVGAYGHGVFAALETPERKPPNRTMIRERLRIIRAREVILATGATERLIAFPGNDIPGVMLAGAAQGYLRRYGVAVGREPLFFLTSDEAYGAVFDLHAAGIHRMAVVDIRAESLAAERARALGLDVYSGCVVNSLVGRNTVQGVRIAGIRSARQVERAADCVLMSGGYSPNVSLARQLGADLHWQDDTAGFVPTLGAARGRIAGAARGVIGLAASARDGDSIALQVATAFERAAAPMAEISIPADAPRSQCLPLWEVRGRGKAFVDLQNDVTADDIRLAHREGYEHIEHTKRYTTHGMGTDQGRIGGLVGSAVLAQARGVPVAAVGQPTPRPFVQPVPLAALAGAEIQGRLKPKRRLALHDWHESAGASFVATGLWLRPLVYAREPGWEAVLREARAVRSSVGITDVSTLGKIDVQGPDAARFLDFVYANTFSTLPVGKARYGIMLREDGMVLDDGTTARLSPEHFVVTTTTMNSAAVLEHLEFCLQAVCPELDVLCTDVGDQWAQFAIAGPRAREVLGAVITGLDISNDALPFMATASATIAGIPARLFRISFSGELGYELAVPARESLAVWTALLEAGRRLGIVPYGLDALNTLRIEKGHAAAPELNGTTSADDLGLGHLLKRHGDFIGRTLAQARGSSTQGRLQLVGVRPLNGAQQLRNGMQLMVPGTQTPVGFITSSTPSVVTEGWLGLALVSAGRDRMGQHLIGASPLHDQTTPVEIVRPQMFDPENARVRR